MRFITGLACTRVPPRIEFDITWHCKGQWYRCGINMTDSTWRSCVYICHTFYVIIIVFSFVHKEVFIPNTNISAYHIHSPDMLASWHGNTLQWHHNERDGVAHHQPQDCLRNCIFRCRSKRTSKILVTGLCEGNSPVTGEFPPHRASNAKNVSIWWRRHEFPSYCKGNSLVAKGANMFCLLLA